MSESATPASPLDDTLRDFLAWVRDHLDGFAPGRHTSEAAHALELPAPYVEALFVSARKRELLRPQPVSRGKMRWYVSTRGDQFLNDRSNQAEQGKIES